MKKSMTAAALIALVSATLFAAAPVPKEDLQKEAKISMARARSIAMTKEPRGTITEVGVNAIDGSIVSVEHESKAKEAAEKKQEAKEKAAKKH